MVHPPHRTKVREYLIDFANNFIKKWDEFADKETISGKYGYRF